MMNVIIFIYIPQSRVIVHKDSCESRQKACAQFETMSKKNAYVYFCQFLLVNVHIVWCI